MVVIVYLAAYAYLNNYTWYYHSSKKLGSGLSTGIYFWYMFIPGAHYLFHCRYNRAVQELTKTKSIVWLCWPLIVVVDVLLIISLNLVLFEELGGVAGVVDQSLLIVLMAALTLYGLIPLIYQYQFNRFNR